MPPWPRAYDAALFVAGSAPLLDCGFQRPGDVLAQGLGIHGQGIGQLGADGRARAGLEVLGPLRVEDAAIAILVELPGREEDEVAEPEQELAPLAGDRRRRRRDRTDALLDLAVLGMADKPHAESQTGQLADPQPELVGRSRPSPLP